MKENNNRPKKNKDKESEPHSLKDEVIFYSDVPYDTPNSLIEEKKEKDKDNSK